MENNLNKVENTLRSIAKRYKSVKYSLGLAILFLMMGISAFSEDVVSQGAVAQKEIMSNEQIAESIGTPFTCGSFTSAENAPTPIIKNNIAKPSEYFTLLYLFAIERKVFSILYRLLFPILFFSSLIYFHLLLE